MEREEKIRKDNIISFKNSLISYLMKAWKKDKEEIDDIIEEYHIVPYIDASYEIYNTMGVQGVIEDLEEYIKEQDEDFST